MQIYWPGKPVAKIFTLRHNGNKCVGIDWHPHTIEEG